MPGRRDPGGLARSLTLLLDGGLASGALDADPDAAARAAQSARVLVDAALAEVGRVSTVGLVLAAGAGRRMGGPKALVRLTEGGPTLVETAVARVLEGGLRPRRGRRGRRG